MMAQLLEDSSFCEEFIQQCPAAVEVLNLVAQECSPGKNAHHPVYCNSVLQTNILPYCEFQLSLSFQGNVLA